ncbi:MAG TPA: class I SAM-dependent methyltransferase [Candidatus Limnocylindrales bacterium]|nr:class I SAM-dependent methyltransferase [Candidatus Limnocylindrales bacterium]
MTTFDERAKDWDTPTRIARARQIAAAIRPAVPLARDDRLADVGAGTGLLGLALVDDVGEVVLLDPSAGMIEVAAQKLAGGSLPSVRADRHDLLADPPPAEPFDVVVSLLVLHHIEDTAAALAAIRDLLVPGGWIALADLDTEDGFFHSADAEGIHHRGFDRGQIETLSQAAGFVDVETRTAMVIDEHGSDGGYPVFLLTGRRA